ncbi:hypothetical protein B4135_2824 [Caldibacillus debilis]|uniref:Uncharacterized protein n=1 Tax=Caldibacillus debilis TaxID=301148 RepID=A0A150LQ34_9BACI|nr:hypothetical protein B4135_2824 [Caldibacillus debilis]
MKKERGSREKGADMGFGGGRPFIRKPAVPPSFPCRPDGKLPLLRFSRRTGKKFVIEFFR